MTENEKTPAEKLTAAINELGLTMTAEFVPWSKSHNKADSYPSLNWLVTLKRGKKIVLTTDYMAGSGHCPAYKEANTARDKYMREKAIKWECENGYPSQIIAGTSHIKRKSGSEPLMPDISDVVYSLAFDVDVINYGSFEDWAAEFGYDSDSRKAEAIYNACVKIALSLIAAIGSDGLKKLQEASEGY